MICQLYVTLQVAKQEEWEEKTKLGALVRSFHLLHTDYTHQPTNSVPLRKMKLCFLIPYGKNKRKKRGSGRRKMERKSDNLRSAQSLVSLPLIPSHPNHTQSRCSTNQCRQQPTNTSHRSNTQTSCPASTTGDPKRQKVVEGRSREEEGQTSTYR